MSDTGRKAECGQPHPHASFAKCVKPEGHAQGHAAPLGYHPAGPHGPEQYEWGEWHSTPEQPLPEERP